MYSLDVNFLKDRQENKKVARNIGPSTKRLPVGKTSNYLYLGLAVGLFLPFLVGSGWLLLQNQNSHLENKNAEIDAQLNALGIQEQQLKKVQEETNKIKGDTQALATVFNQIRPWSATLQDLRDRIPRTVQIETIKQIATSAPQQGQPAPNPGGTTSAPQQGQPGPNPGGIEISGMASSFSDVNDFLLILQQSVFFKPTDTKIITAELIDPISVAGNVSRSPKAVPVKPPPVVRYTIQSSLSDVPASELIPELERKGTSGLVTRIRTLQKEGVIQR